MGMRIVRNAEGNCINFVGSSNPAYWNACLSANINELDANAVDVINDIRTANDENTQYEFYSINYTEFLDKDGNAFADAQAAVDYINENANVLGLSDSGISLNGVDVNFRLDQTSTSIIMDNGSSFGVNTIKAVANEDGTIHIHAIDGGVPSGSEEAGDTKHFEGLEHTRVSVNSTAVSGGINDVVNTLNELFTVGAFEEVVITDPHSTLVADVAGVATTYTLEGASAIDPVGDDIFGNSGNSNLAGLKSVETIDQAGEYFTFDIRNEGQIGFGLVHTDDSFADGYYSGNSSYADPATFGVSNSAHYGFQFSHWFHPTPNGSWTNYGANTGFIRGAGWYNWESQDEWLAGDPVKIRVGLDENGYIAISSLQDDNTTWVLHARSSYPVAEGAEFHLGIKSATPASRVYSIPNVHLLEPAAPAMQFRYIESPDGSFDYPLFATTDEAEYYDTQSGGSGTYHPHVYPDDPTFGTWYMPDTASTMAAASAPSGQTFMSNPITYTEITTLTNTDLIPVAFSAATINVNELSALNYQTQPVDVDYTTTVSGLPAGLSLQSDGRITGTAPEVADNNVNNPSDDYVVTVTRTNTYGSSTGTLTITVANLTAPADPISGFSHHSGSDPLVDSDTMDDGSVIHVNNTVADGERFVFTQSYVETNILPALQGAGDSYIIGLAVSGHDFATVEEADFDAAIMFTYVSSTAHGVRFIRDGVTQHSYDVSSYTDAVYDYAIEINGTSAWLIGCNENSINNEPSPADGGNFSHTYEATNLDEAAPHTIHMAVVSTQADFSSTGLSTLTTPAAPVTNLTSWNKALDFSGSSERAQLVASNVSNQPIAQYYPAAITSGTNGSTSSHSASNPWATAVVFKIDGNYSNQHIWNQGEGAGSNDDNIYLRVDANQNLYFGWGRSGNLNECRIATAISSAFWYGVYIAHDGRRYQAGGATAGNLYQLFDIRMMSGHDNFASSWDAGDYNAWNQASSTTGGRMDRSLSGTFTIGGRGANRNFHGKIASFVSTSLKQGVNMPTVAEAEMMITDPMQWMQDYKVGETYRPPYSSTVRTNWQIGNTAGLWYPANSTQVWLMGDGPNDSYSNMIRNQVNNGDQNYTKLNLISMVSNDIQTVNIQGLT